MSWRTSLAGLLAGLSALAALPDVPPWLRTIAIVVGAVAVALLGALARDAAHAADPPQPDRAPVGPSDVILQRVARGELSPEEGARQKADEIDRRWGVDPEAERRLDAMLRDTAQPNARGDK